MLETLLPLVPPLLLLATELLRKMLPDRRSHKQAGAETVPTSFRSTESNFADSVRVTGTLPAVGSPNR